MQRQEIQQFVYRRVARNLFGGGGGKCCLKKDSPRKCYCGHKSTPPPPPFKGKNGVKYLAAQQFCVLLTPTKNSLKVRETAALLLLLHPTSSSPSSLSPPAPHPMGTQMLGSGHVRMCSPHVTIYSVFINILNS